MQSTYYIPHKKQSGFKLENFVSSIHNQTESFIVCKKIKSINRTNTSNTINRLIESKLSSSPNDVVNSQRSIFHDNSSNANYDQDFLTYSQRYVNSVNTVDLLNSH